MKRTHLLFTISLIYFSLPSSAQVDLSGNSKPDFWERVYFGGGLNLSIGSDVTVIGASPSVGYMITPKFSAGFGISYLHINFKPLNEKANQVGWNIFSRLNITREFFAYSEYEQISWDPIGDGINRKISVPAFYVGVGFFQSFSQKAGFAIIALYDLIHDQRESLNPEPWSIRAGITISPF